ATIVLVSSAFPSLNNPPPLLWAVFPVTVQFISVASAPAALNRPPPEEMRPPGTELPLMVQLVSVISPPSIPLLYGWPLKRPPPAWAPLPLIVQLATLRAPVLSTPPPKSAKLF